MFLCNTTGGKILGEVREAKTGQESLGMRYFLGNRGAYPLDGQYNLTVVLDSGGKAIQTGTRKSAPFRRMRSCLVVPQR